MSVSGPPQSHLTRRAAATAGVGALLACAALGLFARFHALGERQLAVDEYYTLTSVGHILERGVPAFPDGGYYTRDLPGQYLTAASVLLFGDNGFAKRLPPALFGLASVALLFVYARPQLGRAGAAALAAVLLVSSWEVEFSRFARMYAGLQCATLAFLIAYDRALLGRHWHLRYLAHAAGILMVLMQELGVFLLPLLFVPLLLGTRAARFPTRAHAVRYALASSATIAVGLAQIALDLRRWGAGDLLPSGADQAGTPLLRAPDFPFWSAGEDATLSLLMLVALLALSAIAPAAIGLRRGRRDWPVLGVTGLLLGSALLHSFVIWAACALLLLLRFEVHRERPPARVHRAALGASFMIAASWLGYAALTRGWVADALSHGGSLFGALRRAFFGWPDLYSPVAQPWAAGLPEIALLAALAIAYQLWANRKQPLAVLARNPVLPIAAVLLALGVFHSAESGLRYAYFIYPLVLCAIALSTLQLTRAIVRRGATRADRLAAVAFGALFALSSDFSARHLIDVAGPEASYRIGRFEGRDAVWYPRYDYESPAEFLEARVQSAERTPIITTMLPPLSHYLATDHAIFYPRGRPLFGRVSRAQGTRELWSQRRLLSTDDELRAYTDGADRFWVARLANPEQQPFRVEDVWADRLVGSAREYLSVDGRVEVISVLLERPSDRRNTEYPAPSERVARAGR
ncbi:MAG TPA: glycosyltransferase family 39 protein [Myxococcota bacterium]|nr:glycosyltransferase family 39 protein [Myxococcota bacterium]